MTPKPNELIPNKKEALIDENTKIKKKQICVNIHENMKAMRMGGEATTIPKTEQVADGL